ncbi:MAG: outer membrane protein assembly factor BamD [Candidatus Binataceae bacterium]
MKHWPIFLVCALVLAITGCSTRQVPSGEDYYQQARALYSEHQYHGAIESYQRLIDQFPFSPYAEEAELRIGLAYYKMGDYAQASASLSDFQRMHPTSKNLALATYYLAMTHYDQIGRPDRDQSNTQEALRQFDLIERRYPESEFASLAHQRIAICRDLLARNELYIGGFYMTRANFRATESRMAELVEKYPKSPVAPEGLYDLGEALEKEGKKYSAAQAFTALEIHYPKSKYVKQAGTELKNLKQPVDTEDDPLRMVLAESGFNPNESAAFDNPSPPADTQLAAANSPYGHDGAGMSQAGADIQAAGADKAGSATLRTIRLSSSDPPLSVIFDLSGPVHYDKQFQSGDGYATLTVHLKNTTPGGHLPAHMVFDKSIFRDVQVSSDSTGTTVTVNTTSVSRFAIVPLEEPARLLVTFTPAANLNNQTANAGF